MQKKTGEGRYAYQEGDVQTGNKLIFRFADYTEKKLTAQVKLITTSLSEAASAINLSNGGDLRRWNEMAKGATKVVDARFAVVAAMAKWSDISENEQDNCLRETLLLAAMEEYDNVSEAFNASRLHF